jgi:hypothetical protein
MKKHILLLGLVCLIVSSFTLLVNSLPTNNSDLFTGSGNCILCHSGSEGVLMNSAGRDVSPIYHWQSSMMGNAAKDPYWQAKVSLEVEENPHLQEIIEDKCATCHAPMGRTEAIYDGSSHFTFNELKQDPLSLDGVSCAVCHQIDPDNLNAVESFSGNYQIRPVKKMYGPYENPFTTSMVNNTGYTPVHGTHIESSALCATCHTLSTPYVDQDGNVAGYFPEQMPYYEWLNSIYPVQEMSCQTCHMPRVNEEMKISSQPANLANKRSPIFEHHFVGGNTIINQMIKDNYTELGINSGIANLDTTSYYSLKNLNNSSIDVSSNVSYSNNEILVDIILKNKTGHKLPTGFPSRRMWVHFYAMDEKGDTIFESGKYDKQGNILSQTGFELHHDTISNEENVQIYEAVLGNTLNEVTTILLEASQYLKDNRIPPIGFANNQPYDSLIAVTGKAREDENFNKNELVVEGSGSDRIIYKLPFLGNTLKYGYEICYQSIKPIYRSHISASATDESKRFTRMFNNENLTKTEIMSRQEHIYSLTNIKETETLQWKIYPNPTRGKVYVEGVTQLPISYSLYTLNGKLIRKGTTNNSLITLNNLTNGTYFLKVKSGEMEKVFEIIYRI